MSFLCGFAGLDVDKLDAVEKLRDLDVGDFAWKNDTIRCAISDCPAGRTFMIPAETGRTITGEFFNSIEG
jgi:hypothetical protein